MRVLITGSSGLIGSEAVEYYDRHGHTVFGVDNNMRMEFFGSNGDTTWNLKRLLQVTKHFTHCNIDIRNRERIFDLFRNEHFDLIIHCAAQPSHDKAKEIPLIDFEVNAMGTVNLLEATRQFCSDAIFIFMSTNKVYGDVPNEIPLKELETRYDYLNPEDFNGISVDCRIDRSLHSLFGASKLAADIMVQEYGRYFGLNTCVFRGGCLTGPSHSGVELHGFLSYLVKVAVTGQTYHIFGYNGKQVRDNIHSYDVIQAFEAFRCNPRPGEVYNIGGGRNNSVSIIEAIYKTEKITGQKINYDYSKINRRGDHICYITDLNKLQSHFPNWNITHSLDDILKELCETETKRYTQDLKL
ncbi:MAG: NAD-dependent epimerase/dehydratase family protein [Candidatus Methanoperedens sp.]|nr:NAD-dependent epimerase/dehydratase family protein [Candidatus Methanoperedens sp.]